jgi:hypothetical protein
MSPAHCTQTMLKQTAKAIGEANGADRRDTIRRRIGGSP